MLVSQKIEFIYTYRLFREESMADCTCPEDRKALSNVHAHLKCASCHANAIPVSTLTDVIRAQFDMLDSDALNTYQEAVVLCATNSSYYRVAGSRVQTTTIIAGHWPMMRYVKHGNFPNEIGWVIEKK
jgi:hypothetical protein